MSYYRPILITPVICECQMDSAPLQCSRPRRRGIAVVQRASSSMQRPVCCGQTGPFLQNTATAVCSNVMIIDLKKKKCCVPCQRAPREATSPRKKAGVHDAALVPHVCVEQRTVTHSLDFPLQMRCRDAHFESECAVCPNVKSKERYHFRKKCTLAI